MDQPRYIFFRNSRIDEIVAPKSPQHLILMELRGSDMDNGNDFFEDYILDEDEEREELEEQFNTDVDGEPVHYHRPKSGCA